MQGFILNYAHKMALKVGKFVENLDKENIDMAIVSSISILKTLYKLNKFEIATSDTLESI